MKRLCVGVVLVGSFTETGFPSSVSVFPSAESVSTSINAVYERQ